MKKTKKHVFKYSDPEKETPKEPRAKSETKKPEPRELAIIKSDLRRTIFTTVGFLLIVIVYYLIQTKTELLNPVLKLFKL